MGLRHHPAQGFVELVFRAVLTTLLDGSDPGGWVRFPEEVDGKGGELLKPACAMGLEGAKDRRRPYRSGHGINRLKVKCIESEGFLIDSYEPATGSGGCCWPAARVSARKGEARFMGAAHPTLAKPPTVQV